MLSQIVTERERRVSTGVGDEEAVASAQLALYAFRRDTAHSKAAKIEQQQLILRIYETRYANLKNRATSGSVGSEELLLANDGLLQAQQTLEELRIDKKDDR